MVYIKLPPPPPIHSQESTSLFPIPQMRLTVTGIFVTPMSLGVEVGHRGLNSEKWTNRKVRGQRRISDWMRVDLDDKSQSSWDRGASAWGGGAGNRRDGLSLSRSYSRTTYSFKGPFLVYPVSVCNTLFFVFLSKTTRQ